MPPSPPPGMSRRTLLASAVALAAGCAMGRQTDPAEVEAEVRADDATEPLALTGGRIVRDGSTEPATVLVADGRIDSVGSGRPPEGVRTLDLAGATLVPGFIDAHVHLQFADPRDILDGGVTTVRDLGSPREEREAAAATRLGVVLAGRILTPPGGYPTRSWGGRGESREVGGTEDARHAVEEQLAEGATVIKVALEDAAGAPLFAPEVLAGVVAAAHDAGVGVTAHVGSASALDLALEVGIDELAHLPLHRVSASEMERVAAAGVAVCPTLAIRGDDPDGLRALGAFHRAGGRVLYGTDLGNGGTAPGIMLDEVKAMVAAGMSPAEVLDSATAVAAAHLGLPDRGRIEAGAAADLIAVDGDPLADPDVYGALMLVIASGRVLRDELTS